MSETYCREDLSKSLLSNIYIHIIDLLLLKLLHICTTGAISEQTEWLRTVLMLCASFSCSYVMAAEKDVSEAFRSIVATLPNIQKLKTEQEQSLIPTGFV